MTVRNQKPLPSKSRLTTGGGRNQDLSETALARRLHALAFAQDIPPVRTPPSAVSFSGRAACASLSGQLVLRQRRQKPRWKLISGQQRKAGRSRKRDGSFRRSRERHRQAGADECGADVCPLLRARGMPGVGPVGVTPLPRLSRPAGGALSIFRISQMNKNRRSNGSLRQPRVGIWLNDCWSDCLRIVDCR